MPHFHALVSNCEEYKAAYRAAYPIFYARAFALAQERVPASRGREQMQSHRLRIEVEGAIAAALPGAGPQALQAAQKAMDESREHATCDAYADTDSEKDDSMRRSLRVHAYIKATVERLS